MSVKCPECQHENPKTSRICEKCAKPLHPSNKDKAEKTITLERPSSAIIQGDVIAGRYKVIEELGKGGMGMVYKAEDTRLRRTVALKFLPPELTRNEEARKRFIQEARAASALDHPNICTIHEIDEAGSGQVFISMAYYVGGSLKEKLEEGVLKIEEVLDVAIQAAQGLAKAHEKGIVHRDIKPANLMLTGDGLVKIADFGLAKLSGQACLTFPGTIMGTAAYMSPEQSQGEAIDQRTDIWSLGVVLYEMLTGQRPFKGENEQSVIYSILHRRPEPMAKLQAGIPVRLEQVVKKALAKSPDKRYRSAGEMLQELQSIKKELEAGEAEFLVPFWKDLFRRRVLQALVLYLIATWGVERLAGWMVNRFVLSPHLPGFCLAIMLSLIPSVCILAYYHGIRSREKRARALGIGLPLNLLIATGFLLFFFYGKDLGAATKTLRLQDEEGQVIERVVPKTEFRKKFAVFFFENETGDAALDWLGYGTPYLLGLDLTQDIYLEPLTGFGFFDRMKEAGFPEGVRLPLTSKKKIAENFHREYFITGSIQPQAEEYTIKTSLYETRRVKLLTENIFQGSDVFRLVDEISLRLKQDLKIPKRHIEETKDLPVSEIGTSSTLALKHYLAGLKAKADRNWAGSIGKFEQAVKEDLTFAAAYFELQELYGLTNQSERREQAFQSLMQHLGKLPERDQFYIKSEYFFMRKDAKRQLAVVKMWADIFPEDISAHTTLAGVFLYRNQPDDALAEYKRVLELNPEHYEVLPSIGSIYKQKNEYEKALKYYQQYAQKFPMDIVSYMSIGELYSSLGDYVQARSYYEKALLVEPENLSVILALAEVDAKTGNFEEASKQYQVALKISKSPQSLIQVYDALMNFSERKGQMSSVLEYMHLKWGVAEKNLPEAQALIGRLPDIVYFVRAGQKDAAFQAIEAVKARLTPPWDSLLPIAYLSVYLELKDVENAERSLEDYKKFVETFGFEDMRFAVFYILGKIQYLKEEYEEAVTNIQKSLNLSPDFQKVKANLDIGRCYRKLKEHKKAEEYLLKALKHDPSEPKVHYELVLVYLDAGNSEKALEHLKVALNIWKDADQGKAEVEELKAKLAALQESS